MSDVLEHGAGGLVPFMHRRLAHRIEQLARVAPAKRPVTHRRIGRAERGVPELGHIGAGGAGEDGERVDVAALALVGTHAGRRVALEMLDREVALAHGERDVGRGDVVLQIDEALGATARRRRWDFPQGPHRAGLGFGGLWRGAGLSLAEARFFRRLGARREPLAQARAQRRGAGGGARRTLGLDRGSGHEGEAVGVVTGVAARLREQVDRRAPAARDAHQVAGQALGPAGPALARRIERRDIGRAHRLGAVGRAHRMARLNRETGAARRGHGGAAGIGSDIDDGRDLDPTVVQVQRGGVSAVAVGEDQRPPSRPYAVAIEVGPGGAGHHDPGPVVLGEHQGALEGAGGQHHLLRANPPHALARGPRGRRVRTQVVGHPLGDGQKVVVVVAKHRRPFEHPHLGESGQFGGGGGHPLERGPAADLLARAEQRAAQLVLFVSHDDAGAGAAGGQGRGQSGRATAHHQDVAMGMHLFVNVGIGFLGRGAQSRHPADEELIAAPKAARPHERLVIEAGREQCADEARPGAEVETHAGPAVLRAGDEALEYLDLCGPRIGLGARTRPQLDNRVGLGGIGGDDAARTVVFEAPAHQPHAIGQQGRGQRVPRKAREAAAVVSKADRRGAVDAPALGHAKRLRAHRAVTRRLLVEVDVASRAWLDQVETVDPAGSGRFASDDVIQEHFGNRRARKLGHIDEADNRFL